MPRNFPRFWSTAFALLSALSLTLLSVLFERKGPELAPYGNLCGPQSNELCLEPVLNGGLPFAYLFDEPGTSVERKLHLLGDEFRPLPFASDFTIYFFLCLLFAFAWRRISLVSKPKAQRSDA
jgi:hypothetical protein